METFTFISDPGHGWLVVDRKILEELGIANDITGYSYQEDGIVYLEEDCDYSTLCYAWIKSGREPFRLFNRYMEDCPIRQFEHYTVE